jgi:zinc transporter ZupT
MRRATPPYQADDHSAALARTGLLAALAVGIHNVPEGLATFVSTLARWGGADGQLLGGGGRL